MSEHRRPHKDRSEFGAEALRARRHEEASSLRRQDRDRLLAGKRVQVPVQEDGADVVDIDTAEVERMLSTSDKNAIADALRRLQVALASPNDAVVAYIESGACMNSLARLMGSSFGEILLLTINCVSNLAAHHTDLCRHALVVAPQLIALLSSQNDFSSKEACYALGNIAADGPSFADVLISNGVLAPLVTLLSSKAEPSVLEAACFALSGIARHPRLLSLIWSANACPPLVALLGHPDHNVVKEAAFVCAYMTAARDPAQANATAALLQGGVVPAIVMKLFELASISAVSPQDRAAGQMAQFSSAIIPLVRTFGNLACSSDDATSIILSQAPLLIAFQLILWNGLGNTMPAAHAVLKETLWSLSNLAAGPEKDVYVIISAGLLQPLGIILQQESFDVRQEAAHAVLNIASRSSEWMQAAVDANVVPGFRQLLSSHNLDSVRIAVDFIECLCRLHPHGRERVEEVDARIVLEEIPFMTGASEELMKAASFIIDKYFDDDNDAFVEDIDG